MRRIVSSAIVFLVFGCAGQDARTKWPRELWPLVAAPEQHKVVFENEHVRVLRVENPPGGVAPPHIHYWPSVIIWDAPSNVRVRDADGNVTFEGPSAKPGDIVYSEGGQGAPYSVENTGSEVLRLYRVELKTGGR